MAVEQIILEVDERPAVEGAKRANAELAKVEQAAGRAAQGMARQAQSAAQTLVTVADRSRSSIERIVASIERRAAFAGKTALEHLGVEREMALKRVAGDPQAIERVNRAFERLTVAQQAADRASGGLARRLGDLVRNPLQAAGNAVEGVMEQLGPLGGKLLGLGAAFLVAAKGATDLVSAAGKAAEQVLNMADRTGLTVREVEELSAAGRIAGVDVGALVTGMRRLSEALAEGSEEGERGRRWLARLKVEAYDASGQLRPMGDLITEIGEAIARLPNVAEKLRALSALFGGGGSELLPLLKDLPALREEVRKLGIGLDPDLTAKLARADDAMDKLGLAVDRLKRKLAGRLVDLGAMFSPELAGEKPEEHSALKNLAAFVFTMGARTTWPKPKPEPPGPPGAELAEEQRRAREAVEAWQRYLRSRPREVQIEEQIRKEQEKLKVAFEEKDVGAHRAAAQRIETLKAELERRREARERGEALMRSLPALEARQHAERKRAWEEQWREQTEALLREIELREEIERRATQRRMEYQQETDQYLERARELRFEQEERALEISREQQLRGLDLVEARTVEQKLAVESRKLEIELDYLRRSEQLQRQKLTRETEDAVSQARIKAALLFETDAELQRRIAAIREAAAEREKILSADTAAKAEEARQSVAIRQAEIVRTHNERVFEQIKDSAGRVFDALLMKTEGFGKALANTLKTAILTPIREGVSTLVANLLAPLFGARGAARPVGLLGMLGGALPAFGGGIGFPGAPGGTVGFTGPVWLPGTTPRPGAAWGASFAGFAPGLKSWLGIGGSIQTGPGMATTWQAATAGQKLSALGRSDAAALGGGLLALAGLLRGGLSGLAMTTAGGALIGFKYGGPLGAAIGAGAGAAAGLVRLFKKSATEKAREKIKAVYGIDIPDKGVLQQIVETAKQAFGGNLDMAIRSQQIRDLIELYAMSTGQSIAGLPPTMRPVSLIQQSGTLYQQAFSAGSVPTSNRAAGAPETAGPIVIKLDGPATVRLLRGEAVEAIAENPRLVQNASLSATRANAGRRELVALQLSPGTLTA